MSTGSQTGSPVSAGRVCPEGWGEPQAAAVTLPPSHHNPQVSPTEIEPGRLRGRLGYSMKLHPFFLLLEQWKPGVTLPAHPPIHPPTPISPHSAPCRRLENPIWRNNASKKTEGELSTFGEGKVSR